MHGNQITGYDKQKHEIRLMLWSGADFDELELVIIRKKFKDASILYNSINEINKKDLERLHTKSKTIQWDYKKHC